MSDQLNPFPELLPGETLADLAAAEDSPTSRCPRTSSRATPEMERLGGRAPFTLNEALARIARANGEIDETPSIVLRTCRLCGEAIALLPWGLRSRMLAFTVDDGERHDCESRPIGELVREEDHGNG
jgi:hypothetical protein